MSKLKFIHRWIHQTLGLHSLVLIRKDRGYIARCKCGAALKRRK